MGGGTPSGSAPHPHMPSMDTSDVVGQGGRTGAAAVEVAAPLP